MSKISQTLNSDSNEKQVVPGVDIYQVIHELPEGGVIHLAKGKYEINKTLELNKSMRLVGDGIGQTILYGLNLPCILSATGSVTVDLEGITFQNEKGDNPATVVRIDVKTANIKDCSFFGGVYGEGGFGMGLAVAGKTDATITGCHFEDNSESGLNFLEQVNGVVSGCTATKNDAGISLAENAKVYLTGNELYKNHVGVAFVQHASGEFRANVVRDNRGGVLVRGQATPLISKNKLSNAKAAILLAEECVVKIEENEITQNETGILANDSSQAEIIQNQIFKNEEGIHLNENSNVIITKNHIYQQIYYGIVAIGQSQSKIQENMIDENHKTGIKTEEQAQFTIENNQLRGNLQIGVHTRGSSTGTVRNNTLNNHGYFNYINDEGNETLFIDNLEAGEESKPVDYVVQGDEIVVSVPEVGQKISFKELIEKAKPNQVITIDKGYYCLAEPLVIEKPMTFVAKVPGEVYLTGGHSDFLVKCASSGKVSFNGIKLRLNSLIQSNVIIVESGKIELDGCMVGLGKDPENTKRDYGAGISIRGNSIATILNTKFEGNAQGVVLLEKASANLGNNIFSANGYGIIFRDETIGTVSENTFYENGGYGLMAYDESSVIVTKNSCHNNAAGFGFKNISKATVKDNESYQNETHGFFIDNDVDCTIHSNKSFSNEYSGIAVFGDSKTLMEANEVYENTRCGFEIAENANSTVINNVVYGNNTGILLGDTSTAKVESNEVYKNATGIEILGEATATIINNKIYQNSEGAIDNSSENESTIGENEIFENGEGNQDDDEDDENKELDFGDFFAKMFNSENISNDPNIAAIPLGNLFPGLSDSEGEDETINNADDENVVSMDQLKSFFSSIANDPVQSYYSLISDGDTFLQNGNLQEAQDVYKQAIEINRNDPTAYVKISLTSLVEGDVEAAVSYLDAAISVEKYHHDLCLLRASLLLLMGKDDDALLDFLKAIRASLDMGFERSVLNNYPAENNQMCIAVEEFAGSINFEASNATSYLIKGALNIIISGATFFEKDENYVAPIDLFNKAIELDHENAMMYWCRGLVQETYQETIEDYSEAKRLIGNNAEGFYLRGYRKLLESDIEGATQDFSRANELEPENYLPFDKLGLYYLYKEKNLEQAQDVFSNGIEKNPDYPNLYYYRGLVHEKLGDSEAAVSDFRDYIKLADEGGLIDITKVQDRIVKISKVKNLSNTDGEKD